MSSEKKKSLSLKALKRKSTHSHNYRAVASKDEAYSTPSKKSYSPRSNNEKPQQITYHFSTEKINLPRG